MTVEILIYPPASDEPMSAVEFKAIRDDLELTQVELTKVIDRRIERISAWECDRAPVPPIVAKLMRYIWRDLE